MEVFLPILQSHDNHDPLECYLECVGNVVCQKKETALMLLRDESLNEPGEWDEVKEDDRFVDSAGEIDIFIHKSGNKRLSLKIIGYSP